MRAMRFKFIAALKCLGASRGSGVAARGRGSALLTLVNTFYWLYNMFYAWRLTNDPRRASNYFYGTYEYVHAARKHWEIWCTRDFIITPLTQTVFVLWRGTDPKFIIVCTTTKNMYYLLTKQEFTKTFFLYSSLFEWFWQK